MLAALKRMARGRSRPRKRWPWRRARRVASLLVRVPVVFRAYEWWLAQDTPRGPTRDADGVPVPNPHLRVLVMGHGEADAFLTTGRKTADELAALFAERGAPLSGMTRVLDFGCGCGRLARHWPRHTTAAIEGFDINPDLVRWCQGHLPGTYGVSRLRPPLPVAEARYDGVIGFSVFTHLRAETQRAWCAELARVTRPGGVLALTFHDPLHPLCDARVKAALARDGFALPRRGGEGSNGLASFQTHDWARAMFSQWFDVIDIVDSTRVSFEQAVAVLRRPDGEGVGSSGGA